MAILKLPENLKKVEEIKGTIIQKTQNINQAYKSKKGNEIDKANKDLFEYLDSLGIEKETGFYFEMKNHTWQKNHLKVLASISNKMPELNRMPSTTEISSDTGLSEETIYKHLKEFKTNDFYNDEIQKFKFMEVKILASLFKYGVQGDVRACKVYLDYFKEVNKPQPTNYQQNNFIQLNSLKLSFEDISNLPIEVKSKIEKIIMKPKSTIG